MNINEELKTMMMLMMASISHKFVLRPEPQRIQRVQPVYRPSAFPEARLTVVIIEVGIDIVFVIVFVCLLVDCPTLYSTNLYLDFHLLCSMTKLKNTAGKSAMVCHILTTREAVVEVESFPKPDFPNMMNKMEMSDMADFDLDFEPNKVSIV